MKFSIIIPTYQRPEALQCCLESLLKLDYPDWELLLVNDGGETALDEALIKELPFHLINSPHAGPAAARNRGAEAATGEILVFTDDDCRVESDWLWQFCRGFEQKSVDALGGDWLNPFPDDAGAVTWHLYMTFLREILRDTAGQPLLLLSNNVAYKREVFEALSGFDERFPLAAAEDLDLGYRLIAAGYKQDFHPDAKVWHEHQIGMRAFLRQQYRYGRGAYYFQQKSYALELPPSKRGSFHWLLAQYLWAKRAPVASWLLLGLTPFVHRLGKWQEAQGRRSTHLPESS
jgi:GT2 family glycosyltransferase